MDVQLKEGQTVYAADGEKLGKVKEVVEGSDVTYFRVGVTLRPDYWLAATWVDSQQYNNNDDERVTLEFGKKLLDNYKLPAPA